MPAMAGRSKNAQHKGGDIKTSTKGFSLPNVVNNNTWTGEQKEGLGSPPRVELLGGCWWACSPVVKQR